MRPRRLILTLLLAFVAAYALARLVGVFFPMELI